MNTEDQLKKLYKGSLDDFLNVVISLSPFHDYIAQMCLDREKRENM